MKVLELVLLSTALYASASTAASNKELLGKFISEGNATVRPCDNFYRHVCPLMNVEINNHGRQFRMMTLTPEQLLLQRWLSIPGLRHKHVAMLNRIIDINPIFKLGFLLLHSGEDSAAFAHEVIQRVKDISDEFSYYFPVLGGYVYSLNSYSSEEMTQFYNETITLNDQVMAEVKRVVQNANWTKATLGTRTLGDIITMLLDATEMNPKMEPGSDPFNYAKRNQSFQSLQQRMRTAKLTPEESFGNALSDEIAAVSRAFSEYISEQIKVDPTFMQMLFGPKINAANIRSPDHKLVPSVLSSLALIHKIFSTGLPPLLRDAQYTWPIAHELMHSFFGRWDNLLALNHAQEYKHCLEASALDTCDDFQEEKCYSGNATYSEDGPDLEGARIAHKIYIDILAKTDVSETGDRQLFFYSITKFHCRPYNGAQHSYDEKEKRANEHSAEYVRINNVLRQMPEFADAFGCAAGDEMVLPKESICEYFAPKQKS